jgi:hypothetical protein
MPFRSACPRWYSYLRQADLSLRVYSVLSKIARSIRHSLHRERTRDLRARMGHHWTELARGVHYNRLLQADWDTYGAGAFSVEVLERHGPLCSTRLGEARWIAHFAAHGQDGCYNVTRPASPL